MTTSKARTLIGNRIVTLTRYVMNRDAVTQDVAYAKLYGMELFALLSDSETRLFLEEDEYLKTAYRKEIAEGLDALYEFIKPEP